MWKSENKEKEKVMPETRDFRDDLYLEDLPQLDKEMVEDAVKNARIYNFRGLSQDAVFGEAVTCFLEAGLAGMESVGLKLSPLTYRAIMQTLQTKIGDVEIENRPNKYSNEDEWRNGLYIFKKGELAYFVGKPLLVKLSLVSIACHYQVRTNVRM